MSSTISVLNRDGFEEKLLSINGNLKNYIKTLGPEDAVVMETGIGCFHWAIIELKLMVLNVLLLIRTGSGSLKTLRI